MPKNTVTKGTKFYSVKNRAETHAALRAATKELDLTVANLAQLVDASDYAVGRLISNLPRCVAGHTRTTLEKVAEALKVKVEFGPARTAPIGRGTTRRTKAEAGRPPSGPHKVSEPVKPGAQLESIQQVLALKDKGVLTVDEAANAISRLVKGHE